jgi:hypothetical protein
MTSAEIEEKIIVLIQQVPFIPFQVEFNTGEVLVVPHPRLAINHGGAGFIGPEGGIVDIDFANVRAMKTLAPRKSA